MLNTGYIKLGRLRSLFYRQDCHLSSVQVYKTGFHALVLLHGQHCTGWWWGGGSGMVGCTKACRPLVVRCEAQDITMGSYPGWWW